MPHSIDHVNIVVRDLAASVAFYRDVLGFRVTLEATLEGQWIDTVTGLSGVRAECVYLQPEEGPRVELLCFRQPAGEDIGGSQPPNIPGIRHLAFQVSDIDEEYSRLLQSGVECISPPMEVPLASVRSLQGRKRLCYFRGPEGVLLELAEFKPA